MVLAGGTLVLSELSTPCPPGGPLSMGQCAVRAVTLPVVSLGCGLYIAGLSAVLAWVRRLRLRGLADPRAARDWYLVAATIGLPISLLLAFTLVSALR